MKKISIMAAALLFSAALNAQTGVVMNMPDDPASMAMGGTVAASETNAFTVGVNPAGMVLTEKKMAVGVNYMMWSPSEMKANYVGLSGFYKIGDRLGVSLNGKYMMFPSYNMTDGNGNFIGPKSPYDMTIGVGVAYRIIDGLAAGVNLRYFGSSIATSAYDANYKDASAFSADVSLMYTIKGFRVTLAANNLGTKVKYGTSEVFSTNDLPAYARLGFGYAHTFAEKHALSAGVEYDYAIYDSGSAVGAGIEYGFNDMVFVRGGYHYGDNKAVSIPSYASVGLGVKFFGVSLNAAYLIPSGNSLLKNTFNVSLGWEF